MRSLPFGAFSRQTWHDLFTYSKVVITYPPFNIILGMFRILSLTELSQSTSRVPQGGG